MAAAGASLRDRVTVWTAVVGVLALVAGLVLGGLVLFGGTDSEAVTPRPPLRTERFVSEAGGYALQVPAGLRARRDGRATRLVSRDRSLVVTVGPAARGTSRAAGARLLAQLREGYDAVRVGARRTDRVGGRATLTTVGRARSRDGVALRFVVLVVDHRPRPFAITAFAGAGADARRVVPVLNELAGSFRVLPGR